MSLKILIPCYSADRHRTMLLNQLRNPEQQSIMEQSWAGNADEHWASRAPADRGRGSVPPWTATDGCRQAKCINSTGDPCLHHLHLFLEPLHPPFFSLFFCLLNSLCILSVISSANSCRFILFSPARIIVNLINNVAWDWLRHSHVISELIRLLYCKNEQSCRGLRVCRFWFQSEYSRCFHCSVPPPWLSGWSR